MAHNEKSGVAHFACENDKDAINQIKTLLSYLPANNMEDPPRWSIPATIPSAPTRPWTPSFRTTPTNPTI
jgi:acetyl-CoA carboxylase carboxyltransferase component